MSHEISETQPKYLGIYPHLSVLSVANMLSGYNQSNNWMIDVSFIVSLNSHIMISPESNSPTLWSFHSSENYL
jgi:hypothetical protein